VVYVSAVDVQGQAALSAGFQNTTVKMCNGGLNSGGGYNNVLTGPGTSFAVIPDYTDPNTGCTQPLTVALTHEIAEAINGGWFPRTSASGAQCSQLADVCVGNVGNLFGSQTWTVPYLWSNIANACVFGEPGAVGDVNGDGFADLISIGSNNTSGIAVALSNGYGGSSLGFVPLNNVSINNTDFLTWQSASGVAPLVGDFNGDGTADLALTGAQGWQSIPVATSSTANNQLDSFVVTNQTTACSSSSPGDGAMFPMFAADAHLPPVVGDFDGDGFSDIALAGNTGWTSIPIAFSDGQGGFFCTNDLTANKAFVQIITTSLLAQSKSGQNAAQLVAGDFNGDGLSDLALVGAVDSKGKPLATIPVALSNAVAQVTTHCSGGCSPADLTGQPWLSFPVTEFSVSQQQFTTWSTNTGVLAVVGDFNGDGFADIALSGGPGWTTIPVAFSNGGGSSPYGGSSASFTVTNVGDILQTGNTKFSAWAQTKGAELVAGDWTGFGFASLALTAPSIGVVPIAYIDPFAPSGHFLDYGGSENVTTFGSGQLTAGASWAFSSNVRGGI
jgi:hypothetical protein